MSHQVLKVCDLNVSFLTQARDISILKNINLSLPNNSILGITGESGSGKSVTALAITGLINNIQGLKTSGKVMFEGKDILKMPEKEISNIRGKKISIIFQNPEAALNPVIKCGKQISEIIQLHDPKLTKSELENRVSALLSNVGFTDIDRVKNAYPFELSGGQQQRVVIAIAIANKPEIIICDEATSNLDTTTTSEILHLLLSIKRKINCAVIFISHDIKVLYKISDQFILLKDGIIFDVFEPKNIDNKTLKDYTKWYFDQRLPEKMMHQYDATNEPVIVFENIGKSYKKGPWFGKKKETIVLRDISCVVHQGAVLGVLGKTGSGKSTLAKIVAGITDATYGQVKINGIEVNSKTLQVNKNLRRDVQLVLQDAYLVFNPLHKVRDILSEIIDHFRLAENKETKKALILKTLQEFDLNDEILSKLPSQLSGGQRQRLAIARTLLLNPKIIIFDESLSAIDIGNQINILQLINRLRARYLFTTIFISHDPTLIEYISDQVMVLDEGKIVEYGPTNEVFNNPRQEITKQLISAISF